MIDLDYYRELAKERLSEERFKHTLGVEQAAFKLAHKYGINEDSARLAAITHDLEKDRPYSEQLARAKELNLIFCQEDLDNPQILHGRLAAYMLEHNYLVNDKDILNAVANHTLGRPGMSDLEMLIYSADLIEPGRDFAGVDNLREKLYHGLIEGTYACVGHVLAYLQRQGKLVHPITRRTYEDLEEKIRKAQNGLGDIH